MFDTGRALADMAEQIRACRVDDGLTLQQLATRSGVAASTIHKVEARQMVPTVAVLLKISKGLGCRPEKLIRDRIDEEASPEAPDHAGTDGNGAIPSARLTPATARLTTGVWRLDLSATTQFPDLEFDPQQRVIVLVERGEVALEANGSQFRLRTGDCLEVESGRVRLTEPNGSVSLTLIASPAGELADILGAPRPPAANIEFAEFDGSSAAKAAKIREDLDRDPRN